MRAIPPITINDDNLTSSNVPEDDYQEWAVGDTYALEERVIVISGGSPEAFVHKIYESLQADNVGHDPLEDDQDAPVYWLEIGPTNKWAMFDILRNTKTEIASPLIVTITPGERVNSIAALALEADQIQIEMDSDGSTVYDETINLVERDTLTWSDYFFGEFTNKLGIAKFDLPPFTDGVITVTISRTGSTSPLGEVACGALVIGNNEYLGDAELQAVSDAKNFSVVERDDFGNSKLVPRRSIPTTRQRLLVSKDRVTRLLAVRESLNAAPAVWCGLDDQDENAYFNALLILGYYRQFLISLTHPNHAYVDLELEEI